MFADGSTLQQRAERSKNPVAAARSYSAAVDAYKNALELADNTDDRVEAALGLVRQPPGAWDHPALSLRNGAATAHHCVHSDSRDRTIRMQGESLQKWAEVHLTAVRSAPLSPTIQQQENDAKQFCVALCQQARLEHLAFREAARVISVRRPDGRLSVCLQSLQAYELAKEDDGTFVPDALVNRRATCGCASGVVSLRTVHAASNDAVVTSLQRLPFPLRAAAATSSPSGRSSAPRRRSRRRSSTAPARRTRRARLLLSGVAFPLSLFTVPRPTLRAPLPRRPPGPGPPPQQPGRWTLTCCRTGPTR